MLGLKKSEKWADVKFAVGLAANSTLIILLAVLGCVFAMTYLMVYACVAIVIAFRRAFRRMWTHIAERCS